MCVCVCVCVCVCDVCVYIYIYIYITNMNYKSHHKVIKCFTFLSSNNIYTVHLKSTQTKILRTILQKQFVKKSKKPPQRPRSFDQLKHALNPLLNYLVQWLVIFFRLCGQSEIASLHLNFQLRKRSGDSPSHS